LTAGGEVRIISRYQKKRNLNKNENVIVFGWADFVHPFIFGLFNDHPNRLSV